LVSTTFDSGGITFTNVGKDVTSSFDFACEREDTKMVSIGTVVCFAIPWTIADAIVPVPINPIVILLLLVVVDVVIAVVFVVIDEVEEEDGGGSESLSGVVVDDKDSLLLVAFNDDVIV
jgi:hypothetical protein